MKNFWQKLIIILLVICALIWVLIKFVAPKLGDSFASGATKNLISNSWIDLLKSGVASLAGAVGDLFKGALSNPDSGLSQSKFGKFVADWLL